MASDGAFGGYKQSGQGREGIGYSLDNYLEHKTVLIKLEADTSAPVNGEIH